MSIRVGVNGFGRIGRVFFRTALEGEAARSRWSASMTSPMPRPWRTS